MDGWMVQVSDGRVAVMSTSMNVWMYDVRTSNACRSILVLYSYIVDHVPLRVCMSIYVFHTIITWYIPLLVNWTHNRHQCFRHACSARWTASYSGRRKTSSDCAKISKNPDLGTIKEESVEEVEAVVSECRLYKGWWKHNLASFETTSRIQWRHSPNCPRGVACVLLYWYHMQQSSVSEH